MTAPDPSPAPDRARPTASRGVTLSEDEAWAMVTASHTGIWTTLRRDGMPVSLPLWFTVIDRRICLRTRAGSKKVQRLERDPRCTFLVEAGEAWAELRAVHAEGRARLYDEDHPLSSQVAEALDAKYQEFRPAPAAVPASAARTYAKPWVVIAIDVERFVSWDNRRITGG